MDFQNIYQTVFTDFPDVVTADGLCKMLGICEKTAYKLLKEGKIRSFMIGNTYRIPKVFVLEYLDVIQKPITDNLNKEAV